MVLHALFFTLILSAAAITPPSTDSGADQTIFHGKIAILNNTGSDPIIGYQWSVNTKTLDLSPMDNSNGVDVEVYIGTAGGIENITLAPFHGNQEIYKRPVE